MFACLYAYSQRMSKAVYSRLYHGARQQQPLVYIILFRLQAPMKRSIFISFKVGDSLQNTGNEKS